MNLGKLVLVSVVAGAAAGGGGSWWLKNNPGVLPLPGLESSLDQGEIGEAAVFLPDELRERKGFEMGGLAATAPIQKIRVELTVGTGGGALDEPVDVHLGLGFPLRLYPLGGEERTPAFAAFAGKSSLPEGVTSVIPGETAWFEFDAQAVSGHDSLGTSASLLADLTGADLQAVGFASRGSSDWQLAGYRIEVNGELFAANDKVGMRAREAVDKAQEDLRGKMPAYETAMAGLDELQSYVSIGLATDAEKADLAKRESSAEELRGPVVALMDRIEGAAPWFVEGNPLFKPTAATGERLDQLEVTVVTGGSGEPGTAHPMFLWLAGRKFLLSSDEDPLLDAPSPQTFQIVGQDLKLNPVVEAAARKPGIGVVASESVSAADPARVTRLRVKSGTRVLYDSAFQSSDRAALAKAPLVPSVRQADVPGSVSLWKSGEKAVPKAPTPPPPPAVAKSDPPKPLPEPVAKAELPKSPPTPASNQPKAKASKKKAAPASVATQTPTPALPAVTTAGRPGPRPLPPPPPIPALRAAPLLVGLPTAQARANTAPRSPPRRAGGGGNRQGGGQVNPPVVAGGGVALNNPPPVANNPPGGAAANIPPPPAPGGNIPPAVVGNVPPGRVRPANVAPPGLFNNGPRRRGNLPPPPANNPPPAGGGNNAPLQVAPVPPPAVPQVTGVAFQSPIVRVGDNPFVTVAVGGNTAQVADLLIEVFPILPHQRPPRSGGPVVSRVFPTGANVRAAVQPVGPIPVPNGQGANYTYVQPMVTARDANQNPLASATGPIVPLFPQGTSAAQISLARSGSQPAPAPPQFQVDANPWANLLPADPNNASTAWSVLGPQPSIAALRLAPVEAQLGAAAMPFYHTAIRPAVGNGEQITVKFEGRIPIPATNALRAISHAGFIGGANGQATANLLCRVELSSGPVGRDLQGNLVGAAPFFTLQSNNSIPANKLAADGTPAPMVLVDMPIRFDLLATNNLNNYPLDPINGRAFVDVSQDPAAFTNGSQGLSHNPAGLAAHLAQNPQTVYVTLTYMVSLTQAGAADALALFGSRLVPDGAGAAGPLVAVVPQPPGGFQQGNPPPPVNLPPPAGGGQPQQGGAQQPGGFQQGNPPPPINVPPPPGGGQQQPGGFQQGNPPPPVNLPPPAGGGQQQGGAQPPAPVLTPLEQQMQDLVNKARRENGNLPPVRIDQALSAASLAHSVWMNQRNWGNQWPPLSHRQEPGSPSETFGQRAAIAGTTAASENVALNGGDAAAVMARWMSSDGHRRNILNPNVTRMGIGKAGSYWTQMFGL